MSVERYANLIKRLLPSGLAFEKVKEHPLISGLAGEYSRIEERAQDLLTEMDPRTASEMIGDWEALLGLPDEATPAGQDLSARRIQAGQKLGNVGGISKRFYEELALLLGHQITIERITDFRVGRARVGGQLTNTDRIRQTMRVGSSRVGTQLRTPGWRFYFRAVLPITAAEYFKAGRNRAGDRLIVLSNDLIQITIRKLKPAHVGVIFTFKEAE